jgi:hypothetical protein
MQAVDLLCLFRLFRQAAILAKLFLPRVDFNSFSNPTFLWLCADMGEMQKAESGDLFANGF